MTRDGLFKAGLRLPTISVKSDFRSESFNRKFRIILSAYSLMNGCYRKSEESYLKQALEQTNIETQLSIELLGSANRPSNNWALIPSCNFLTSACDINSLSRKQFNRVNERSVSW